jgi:ATP adenylyltransferase
MEHVQNTRGSGQDCLFEPPGNEAHVKEYLLLYREADCLCLLNRFPYTNGHLLVAPTRHVACLTELSPQEMAPFMELVRDATEILRKNLQPDGFNIGINIGSEAGAGVADHLHVHIVPRWQNDHNFMTVLAEVRAIPEHLDTTYDRLLPMFQDRTPSPVK